MNFHSVDGNMHIISAMIIQGVILTDHKFCAKNINNKQKTRTSSQHKARKMFRSLKPQFLANFLSFESSERTRIKLNSLTLVLFDSFGRGGGEVKVPPSKFSLMFFPKIFPEAARGCWTGWGGRTEGRNEGRALPPKKVFT